MEEGHQLAAHALLQQLTGTTVPARPGPAPAPLPPAPPAPDIPPPAAVGPAPVATPAPAPPPPEQTRPEVERCAACNAVLSPAMAWCQLCLTPRSGHAAAPSSVPAAPFPPVAPTGPPAAESRPGVARSAIWLAVVVIAFNIAVQATTYALERSAQVQPDTAIAIGLWVGLAFYLVVAAFAVRTRAAASVRTSWTVGDPRVAVWKGLLAGGTTSVIVLGLQSLATHHLVGDPTVQLVVSDGSLWRVLAALVLFVGIGPVVEEYIFRGVLAESLRGRGVRAAVSVSALLFALAHLRPAGLVYYSVIGGILGRLYFRYGMKSSVAAHAVFNGLLVVAAIISVIGPASSFHDDGAVLRLPAAWKSVTPPSDMPFQFAARGPSGAAILVLDRSVPDGTTFDPAAVAAAAQNHELPIPATDTVTSTSTVNYPAGAAAVLMVEAQGHPGKLVLMLEHDREWMFVLSSAGSSKAVSDFDQMMQKLTLP